MFSPQLSPAYFVHFELEKLLLIATISLKMATLEMAFSPFQKTLLDLLYLLVNIVSRWHGCFAESFKAAKSHRNAHCFALKKTIQKQLKLSH